MSLRFAPAYGSKWGHHTRLRGGNGEVEARIRAVQAEAIERNRRVMDLIEREEERKACEAWAVHARCIEETNDAARHDLREENA